jgi:nicotinamide-nucleotide amidase
MELENKVLSRELQQHLYESELTLGTAESCTGGRIAEAIIATPGASEYFKGGIICYTDEIKTKLLNIDSKLIEEKKRC